MRKLVKTLQTIYRGILAAASVVLVILAIYQVIGRYLYFLHLNIAWTEETLRFLFVATCMLGVPCAVTEESLTRVNVISQIVEDKNRYAGIALGVLRYAVQIICCALIAFYGTRLAIENVKKVTVLTSVSYGLVYAPIGIGMGLAVIVSILKLIMYLRDAGKEVKG